MVGGRGVRLAEESAVLEPELFLALDLDRRGGPQSEALVRLASAVEPAWLPADALRTAVEVEFDPERERVVGLEADPLRGPGPLREPRRRRRPRRPSRCSCQAAAERLDRALPLDDPEVAGFLARVRCLREWMPELGLPAFDAEELVRAPPRSRRRQALLRRAAPRPAPRRPARRALLGAAPGAGARGPERLEVPSGSRIRCDYEPGRPPVLAARIQELFGLAETPRLAAGRVPVLHAPPRPQLPAAAGHPRPAELLGEHLPAGPQRAPGPLPKHAWPEDPWTAKPQRKPRQKT